MLIADNQISPRKKNVFTKAKCLVLSVGDFIWLFSLLVSTNIVSLFYKTWNWWKYLKTLVISLPPLKAKRSSIVGKSVCR